MTYGHEPPTPDGSWNSYLVVALLGFCIGTFGGALAALAVHHAGISHDPQAETPAAPASERR